MNEVVKLVNPRGRVVIVEAQKADELLANGQGFRKILNPKEDYYPQYDKSLSVAERVAMSEEGKKAQKDLMNDIENADLLEGVEMV